MTAFYELVISGSFLYVKGLITGICLGANQQPDIIFNKEHKIETETLGEIFKEYIGLSDVLVHLIVPEYLLDLIKEKITFKANRAIIKSTSKIESAEFEFDFEAYTEKQKKEIKKVFENLPANVKFSKRTSIDDKVYKDSEGIELYSPAHSIEYTGKGELEGTFPEIFDLFKKCTEHPLINVDKMNLKLVKAK
jgi:hypothetical protein